MAFKSPIKLTTKSMTILKTRHKTLFSTMSAESRVRFIADCLETGNNPDALLSRGWKTLTASKEVISKAYIHAMEEYAVKHRAKLESKEKSLKLSTDDEFLARINTPGHIKSKLETIRERGILKQRHEEKRKSLEETVIKEEEQQVPVPVPVDVPAINIAETIPGTDKPIIDNPIIDKEVLAGKVRAQALSQAGNEEFLSSRGISHAREIQGTSIVQDIQVSRESLLRELYEQKNRRAKWMNQVEESETPDFKVLAALDRNVLQHIKASAEIAGILEVVKPNTVIAVAVNSSLSGGLAAGIEEENNTIQVRLARAGVGISASARKIRELASQEGTKSESDVTQTVELAPINPLESITSDESVDNNPLNGRFLYSARDETPR